MFQHLVAQEEKHEFILQVQLYQATLTNLFTTTTLTLLKTSHPHESKLGTYIEIFIIF